MQCGTSMLLDRPNADHYGGLTVSVTDRERVAIHEAGHVLVAVLLGRSVICAQLEPTPHTSLKKKRILPRGRPKTASDRALLEGELMLVLAGIAAERIMEVEEGESLAGALDDLQRATGYALQIAGAARAEATVAHFLAITERMLRRNADRISETAAVLMGRGVLDANDIADLIPRR